MKKIASGFSILFVCMLIAALSVAALSFMRSSSFLTSLAVARENREYQYWACLGLKSYAQSLILAGSELPEDPMVFAYWPHEQSPYQGVIKFSARETEIQITVQLRDQKMIFQELSFVTLKPIT